LICIEHTARKKGEKKRGKPIITACSTTGLISVSSRNLEPSSSNPHSRHLQNPGGHDHDHRWHGAPIVSQTGDQFPTLSARLCPTLPESLPSPPLACGSDFAGSGLVGVSDFLVAGVAPEDSYWCRRSAAAPATFPLSTLSLSLLNVDFAAPATTLALENSSEEVGVRSFSDAIVKSGRALAKSLSVTRISKM
ncbi:hypothetical protein QQP08_007352, partial [Theobroma cacao]